MGVLLGSEDDKENHLTDSQISDNIIGLIFAAHDTTASVLTWLLKYLHDNDDILEAVTVLFFLPSELAIYVYNIYNFAVRLIVLINYNIGTCSS